MGKLLVAVALVVVALAAGAWWLGERERGVPGASWELAEALGAEGAEGFERAEGVREIGFPGDHGAHPEFRLEWWYFTGNLEGEGGRRFGYQLTFFRRAVAPPGTPGGASAWRTRQVYLAHFAVTDVEARRFYAFEETARGAAGLAGAEAEPFRVWVEGWRAESAGGGAGGGVGGEPAGAGGDDDASGLAPPASDPAANRAAGDVFPLRLAAAAEGVALDLLVATTKPPVLQGDRGLSVKGPGAGNASYYYSLTRLPTRGTVTVGGERFAVEGLSWLDREWSTTLLGPGERGWDWLALQLDDGREVTGWRIRRPSAPLDRLDALTLVERDGTPQPLDPAGHRLLASSPWTSPAGTRYPTAWRLTGPQLDLAVSALLPDQELPLSIRYWEGAVAARGEVTGSAVTARGYVEMTGYE
jgi:predicted secreted hydrolase